MKKFRFLIVAVIALVLTLAFSLGVSAQEDKTLTISEDYKTVTYMGEEYFFVSTHGEVDKYGYDPVEDVEILYTEKQSAVIERAKVFQSGIGMALRLNFKGVDAYSDSYVYLTYCSVEARDEYLRLLEGEAPIFTFMSEDISKDDLFGDSNKMSGVEVMTRFDGSRVYNEDESRAFYICRGEVLFNQDGECYYLDYFENSINRTGCDYILFDELIVHKITNQDIIDSVIEKEEVDTTDNSKLILTAILLAILFLALPLAVAIICTLKLRSASKHYRKLLKIVSYLAYATAASFILLAVVVLLVI
ncbi:MAG: hypothetical protein E7676_02440 [Ruminococcaceae bacterium]|nr:hypothetical protein [Oscillospiraceae bacterium]